MDHKNAVPRITRDFTSREKTSGSEGREPSPETTFGITQIKFGIIPRKFGITRRKFGVTRRKFWGGSGLIHIAQKGPVDKSASPQRSIRDALWMKPCHTQNIQGVQQ